MRKLLVLLPRTACILPCELARAQQLGDKCTLLRNDINLPNGRLNTNLFIGRLAYALNPTIFTQNLNQFNDVIDSWSANSH